MLYDQDATAELRSDLAALHPPPSVVPSPRKGDTAQPAPEPVEHLSWAVVAIFSIPIAVVVFAASFALGRYVLA
jgi:hypothetical protein